MTTHVATPLPVPAYGVSLTLEEAKHVVSASEAEAKQLGLENVIIAVVDAGGHLVLLERLDGAQFGSIRAAEAKAHSAVAFKRPTKVFQDSLAATPRILAIDGAMPVEGGFPLIVGDRVVGGIGVAGGLPEQDTQIAKAGVEAIS